MNQNLKDKEFQRICRDEANAGETVIVGTQKPATETVLAKIRELWNYLERRGMSHVEIRSGVFAADGREICEHGVPDGEWCEPCNKEMKRARNAPENL